MEQIIVQLFNKLHRLQKPKFHYRVPKVTAPDLS